MPAGRPAADSPSAAGPGATSPGLPGGQLFDQRFVGLADDAMAAFDLASADAGVRLREVPPRCSCPPQDPDLTAWEQRADASGVDLEAQATLRLLSGAATDEDRHYLDLVEADVANWCGPCELAIAAAVADTWQYHLVNDSGERIEVTDQ